MTLYIATGDVVVYYCAEEPPGNNVIEYGAVGLNTGFHSIAIAYGAKEPYWEYCGRLWY